MTVYSFNCITVGLGNYWPYFSISLGFRVSIEILDKSGLAAFWLVVASVESGVKAKNPAEKIYSEISVAKNSTF